MTKAQCLKKIRELDGWEEAFWSWVVLGEKKIWHMRILNGTPSQHMEIRVQAADKQACYRALLKAAKELAGAK